MAEKAEVFLCPFCGAPYKELIPSGVVQVKCHYCGATVLVPPRLGGLIQRCPNHPDVLAIGLCNDCNKSYCDNCLYIYESEHEKLHLCAQCYKNRTQESQAQAISVFIVSMIFIGVFLLITATQSSPSSAVGFLMGGLILLLVSVVTFSKGKRPISVREARSQPAFSTYTPKTFLKKCIKCGEDIPIASEKCRYCGAKQSENKAHEC
jgi:ribosomal protein L40E